MGDKSYHTCSILSFLLISFTLISDAFEFDWQNDEYPKQMQQPGYGCNDALLNPESLKGTNEIPAYHISLIEAANEKTGIGAKCIDGSPAAYYFRPTPGIDTNDTSLLAPTKYFIYLAGGAWCSPVYGHHIACGWDDCFSRSLGTSGSTLFDPPYQALPSSSRQYFSTDPTINPLSYNWNIAWTRYCDGASYSNNLDDPIAVPGKNVSLYFRGHRNLIAIMDDLLHNKGMMNATDIVVGGCSSGGLAVYLNIDFMSEYITEKTGNSEIRIMGLADSGFFYNYESNANYSDAIQYLYNSQNMSVNRYCIDAYGDRTNEYYNCAYAENVSPYIKTKIFSTQSQYDDWQIYCDLNNGNVTMINEYGMNITSAYITNFTATSKNNNHCGYLSSCRYHCGWHNVYNISAGHAMYDFYYGNNTKNFYFDNETYPCPNNCCNIS
eukprot:148686_1